MNYVVSLINKIISDFVQSEVFSPLLENILLQIVTLLRYAFQFQTWIFVIPSVFSHACMKRFHFYVCSKANIKRVNRSMRPLNLHS